MPIPLVLDTTVLRELARGDAGVISLMQQLDARGQPLVMPALAVTGALLDIRTDDAIDSINGLVQLARVVVAPLNDTGQALALARMVADTGLAAWDAHAATIADLLSCPILTCDAVRWKEPSRALDEPLHVVEIADPDDR